MRNALTAAEYWEWRTTIGELDIEKQKLANAHLEFKILQRDAEIHAVRQQLFLRTRMDAAKQSLEKAKAEYERFKGVLEESLGQSLNNKVIDDITFEVSDAPSETNNNPPETEKKE